MMQFPRLSDDADPMLHLTVPPCLKLRRKRRPLKRVWSGRPLMHQVGGEPFT